MLQLGLSCAVLIATALPPSRPLAQSGSGTPTFPGTDEGLVLLTGLGGAAPDGLDIQSAVVGDALQIELSSTDRALDGAVLLLGWNVVDFGSVPVPSLPGLALDLSQQLGSVVLGVVNVAAPLGLQLDLPAGLAGRSVVLQGVALPVLGPAVAENGLFAASDGRRLDVSADPGPPVIREDLRITAVDATAGDGFGFDVWLAGDLLAVGAPFDNGSSLDNGSAYTFDATTGAQIRKFTTPGFSFLGDNFGSSVVLQGDRLLVGAPRDDRGTAEQLSGKIYVFNALTGQTFPTLLPVATGTGGTIAHALGESTDLSDAFLVAGSRGDSALELGGGSVHLFNPANGAFLRKLFPEDPAPAVNFGTAVAVSGTRVAVGSPFDSISAFQSGSAYLFDGATGQQLHKFAPTDTDANDLAGLVVELHGDTVLVGTPFFDGPDGTPNVGAVYVYDAVTGNLLQRLESPSPAPDGRFGDGLAMSDAFVLIGESFGANSAGIETGVIHVYDPQTFERLYRLETSDGAAEDALGESIEIEGKRVVAGARGADFFGDLSGAAYLFTLP
jgi:outer membrane protein assembly factor BamB